MSLRIRSRAPTLGIGVLFLLAICPASIAAAGNTGTLDSTALLRDLARALGGSANIDNIHTIYFEWRARSIHVSPSTAIQSYDMGAHIAGREWLTSDGNDRIETRSAVLQAPSTLEVLEAGTPPNGWMLVGDQGSPSGNTTGQMQGPDLQREISHVYWTTFGYLTSAGVPGTVTYEQHPGTLDYLLKMQPHGGEPIRTYLNRKTFLPDKVQIGEEPPEMVIVPKVWKPVGGVLFPFDMTVTLLGTHLTLHYAFTKVQLNVTPPKGAFQQPTPAL